MECADRARIRRWCLFLAGVGAFTTWFTAAPASARPTGTDHALSLTADNLYASLPQQAGRQPAEQETTTTTTTETETEEGRTLGGPYFLRSADPEPPGELELKFIYGYEREHDEEEHEFEFELEWGMMENWEFILAVPVVLGEGKVEGNGDIGELGFHTLLWHEDGALPAFAVRNLFRIPTGYHSDGVDYLLRGLFTWTLNDRLRLHFNPYGLSRNGNFDEEDDEGFSAEEEEGDERHFQWGAAIGIDYLAADNLLLIADYQNNVSEHEGNRNQHSIELGADWEFADDRTLGLQTEFEIDGDDSGPNFGARISYIIEIEAPRLGG